MTKTGMTLQATPSDLLRKGEILREPTKRLSTLPYRPSVLIVGETTPAAGRLKAFLRSCNFNVEIHADLGRARDFAQDRKLDGVFLFWGGADFQVLVNELRASGLNRNSMICAVLANRPTRNESFQPGCNFTFDLNSFSTNLQRYLRAMFGLVVKEHRRYFRSSSAVEVGLLSPSNGGAKVECLDISTTGVGLHLTSLKLGIHDNVSLAIDFADGRPPARVDAQVRWIESGGKAGLRFLDVPLEALERLQACIEKAIEAAEAVFSKAAFPLG